MMDLFRLSRVFLLLMLPLLLVACSPQQIRNVFDAPGELTEQDVSAGLKEALRVGAGRAVDKAAAEDGFWNDPRLRIPFPQEAIAVRNTLLDLGMRSQVERFEKTMNHAAGLASREAVNVFIVAVNEMTIDDAFTILRGGDHAATNFLHDRTNDTLRTLFLPIVERATSQVALAEHWRPLANAYNTATIITGNDPVDPDLDLYITNKTMDGLFMLLAEEERRIREDPMARTTDILRRVFARQ